MAKLFATGETIQGEKIYFCFGSVPSETYHDGRQYTGTLNRNGFAGVDVPLYSNISRGGPTKESDEIHCKSARFKCHKRLRILGKKRPCGNHTCWQGYLRENASATINIPFPQHQ